MSAAAVTGDAARTRVLRADVPEASAPWSRWGLSLGVLLLTLLLIRWLMHSLDAPIAEIAVTGALRHVRADQVRAVAAPVIEGRLFEADLDAVRSAVEALPWVAHARVDREWPARIAVRIWERELFARWGEREALSTEGRVFNPGEPLPATLPRLGGAPGSEQTVMGMYGQLADRLAETPFAITGLVQDARGEWLATSQNGVALRFGQRSPLEQVAGLKAVVLPALRPRLAQLHYVDLRYANGFAAGWHEDRAVATNPDPDAPAPVAPAPLPALPGVSP